MNINVSSELLAEFCRRHHIRKLSLYGSVLRDDFRPDSDVDVLVEFEPGHVVGYAIIDMEEELTRMFGGLVRLGVWTGSKSDSGNAHRY